MKEFWVQMIDLDFFFRYLKGRCYGNQFCEKMQISLFLSLWHSETDTSMWKAQLHKMFRHVEYGYSLILVWWQCGVVLLLVLLDHFHLMVHLVRTCIYPSGKMIG